MNLKVTEKDGFTLVEVVIAIILLGLVIGGMLTTFVMGRISTYHARYRTQATSLMQSKAEELLAGTYDEIQSKGPIDLIVDPGKDGEWGTGDDMNGTMVVEVADVNDLDFDGDTSEQEIDVDLDGQNDTCKAVTIRLDWFCTSYGGDRSMSARLDTLISKR